MYQKERKKLNKLYQKIVKTKEVAKSVEQFIIQTVQLRENIEDRLLEEEAVLLREIRIQIEKIEELPKEKITDEVRKFRETLETVWRQIKDREE